MSEGETTLGGSACPACGVMVATGYPRCPKCHAELPDAPTHGGDASAVRVQGGTTVATGSSHTWIYAVGGAAVVAALIVFVLSGSDADDEPAPAPEAQPASAVVEERATRPVTNTPPPRTDDVVAPTPAVDPMLVASRTLLGRLEAARMWSTVDISGQGLEVKSAYCADKKLSKTIDAVADELRSLGVTTVSCFERHGPKVFTRDLGGAAPPAGD